MAKIPTDQEFVEYVVKNLVNKPDDVSIDRKIDEMGVLLTLKVNPSDLGIVIGKQGRTIQAIRVLARIVGAKNNARVNLRLESPTTENKSAKKEKAGDVDIDL